MILAIFSMIVLCKINRLDKIHIDFHAIVEKTSFIKPIKVCSAVASG
jgi:hypothetical protein